MLITYPRGTRMFMDAMMKVSYLNRSTILLCNSVWWSFPVTFYNYSVIVFFCGASRSHSLDTPHSVGNNTQHSQQTSMTPPVFEPTISASERPQTHIVYRAATGFGKMYTLVIPHYRTSLTHIIFLAWTTHSCQLRSENLDFRIYPSIILQVESTCLIWNRLDYVFSQK